MMNKTTRRTGVVAGTVAALLVAGVAFAAWSNYGEDSATVTARTATPLTVTATDVTGLFPTGSVNVPFTVNNTNPYAVTLDNATLKSVTVDAAHNLCNPTVVTGVDVALADVVAPSATSASHNFPVTMSNAATDACQGAVFTVTLGITGLSS